MSSEEPNKALVRRYFDDIMNGGNLDAIDELIASDCVFTIPTLRDPFVGPKGYRNLVNLLRTAFPDLLFKVVDELAEGDTVVDRWTATGTSDATEPAPDRR
jgi:ketosteroid isomerase-like protein